MRRIAIIGASGKLGQYMIQQALDKGYQVNGVCRAKSVHKLARFSKQITIFPGHTDDRQVIAKAVDGCDAVLTVLMPWGMNHYSSNTAQAILDHAPIEARLVFSCGWHISQDGLDKYTWHQKAIYSTFTLVLKLLRIADTNDQVEACRRIFSSNRSWTVVRASNLEEGETLGHAVWAERIGDPAISKNLIRRIDFAQFMVDAIENTELIQRAPAISHPVCRA
jgi:hypothetical protein